MSYKASINVEHPTLITAYPASADPGELNLREPETISVLGGNAKSRRNLRWTFFSALAPGEKKLDDNFGMTSLQLTTVAEVGLYVIYPRQRGFQRGWVQYVRVILSECPKGYFHETGPCNGGPIVCQHGGVVNPRFPAGLCTCPPGYAGPLCQHPINADQFGNNGQFSLVDMLGTSGRGITISQSIPFGTTCAPGFWGVGCQKKCSDGFFGPGCAFVCHCVDRFCSVTGVCANGCDPSWQGPTCQYPVP
ncbi:putative receptor-type tyrosine-protein phosphatase F [Apostichopus japonicus]|uniref:Putative receptor-type tyrosine-protein phosphatase F n=1 Tax=Stichopus japonicus TaxID=307972 RepID=A0A2G8LK37_STIJA|nr:putative receptor-type tyrosine-protein phosphatase F [Apostichopus japonicus]